MGQHKIGLHKIGSNMMILMDLQKTIIKLLVLEEKHMIMQMGYIRSITNLHAKRSCQWAYIEHIINMLALAYILDGNAYGLT